MSKDTVADWDTTFGNNTDVGGTSIAGSASVSLGNDAMQKIMAQIKAGVPYLSGSSVVFPSGSTLEEGATLADSLILTAATWQLNNRLINGNGIINQRVYTTVADDVYWCDRHYVLTQTDTITPTILSDVANGLPSMMRLTQSQAVAQRMGNAQIIESINCRDLRGQTVSLIGKLRCSSSQAIRYAVLEWTGTADSVTSDVVNDWTNATFTAGQFFKSTTTNVLSVGTVTPSAATVTNFVLTATVGSSANNLIVVIWTEGTAAQNVTLDVAWELVRGDMTGETYPLSMRSVGEEQDLCDRYFQAFGARGTATVGSGFAGSTTTARIYTPFRTKMRGTVGDTPTVTVSTASDLQVSDGVTLTALTNVADNQTDINGGTLTVTVAAGLTQYRPYHLMLVTNVGRLNFSREL